MSSSPTLPLPSVVPTPIQIQALTPVSFSPFGTAICSPLPSTLDRVPSSIPRPLYHTHQQVAIYANQKTALKTSPISPLVNEYPTEPSSRPQMSMFSCFPRRPLHNLKGGGDAKFPIQILERHPYTTQTFTPLGLSPSSPSTIFLVVVAPSLDGGSAAARSSSGEEVSITNPPDLSQVHAFLARGAQAVTYAAGTWHAPMIVLGEGRVDFVVTQFVNGVSEDDCQEVLIGGSGDLVVDLSSMDLATSEEKGPGATAKL